MPANEKQKPHVFFGKLHAECKRRLLDQLRKEHNLAADPVCDDCIQFVVSSLHVDEHPRDARGAVVQYMSAIAPGVVYPIDGFYLTIADQLRQKSDRRDVPKNMSELIDRKAITSSEVQNIFSHMMPIDREKHIWSEIATVNFGPDDNVFAKERIRREFSRYAADKKNPKHKIAAKIKEAVRAAIAKVKTDPDKIKTLGDLLQAAFPLVEGVPESVDPSYVKGAILLEFRDDDAELPPADKKSEGEAA
jgi:hypothetical protein